MPKKIPSGDEEFQILKLKELAFLVYMRTGSLEHAKNAVNENSQLALTDLHIQKWSEEGQWLKKNELVAAEAIKRGKIDLAQWLNTRFSEISRITGKAVSLIDLASTGEEMGGLTKAYLSAHQAQMDMITLHMQREEEEEPEDSLDNLTPAQLRKILDMTDPDNGTASDS